MVFYVAGACEGACAESLGNFFLIVFAVIAIILTPVFYILYRTYKNWKFYNPGRHLISRKQLILMVAVPTLIYSVIAGVNILREGPLYRKAWRLRMEEWRTCRVDYADIPESKSTPCDYILKKPDSNYWFK